MSFVCRIMFAFIVLVAMSSAAHADTLYTLGNTGELPSPSTITAAFTAGAGAGNVTFQIQGYRTLDGSNCCTDVFHMVVNGSELITATWALGGGGTTIVFAYPFGTTIVHSGQTVDISAPVSFINGLNTVDFSYTGSFQGLGDEAWGLNHVTITGNSSTVPEPATLTLLLTGLLGVGFSAYRKGAAR
jgi:hypothetical protein